MEELLSMKQAAEILGLTPQRVGIFCRQGRLKGARKIGNYWAIPKISAETFIRQPHGIKPKPKEEDILIKALKEANEWKQREEQANERE